MSAETSKWLNTMVLIGFTEVRGNAWHYRESDQGVEPNHYPQAIPLDDIKRRLFGWEPVEGKIKNTVRFAGRSYTEIVPNLKSLNHPDSHALLGVVGKGFKHHSYWTWLVKNCGVILHESELQAGSAGLLKEGSHAWVQFEMPDTIDGPHGIKHRPYFTATTAADGSMSSTYQIGSTLVVCDNTRAAALAENTDQRVKVSHRSGSLDRIGEVREQLKLMYQTTEEINDELAVLVETKVTDDQWERFLVAHLGDEPKEAGRGLTNCTTAHDDLTRLYRKDDRVAPWNGTAFGALQALNTYRQHERTVKGMTRPERNAWNMATGVTAKEDIKDYDKLQLILAA